MILVTEETMQTKSSEPIDKIAMILSALCLVHCLLTPIILVAFPFLQFVSHNYDFHLWMAIALVSLAGLAFYRGYRVHKKAQIFVSGTIGLMFLVLGLFAPSLFTEDSLMFEIMLTSIGSVILIWTHLTNIKFCRCACCEEHAH